MDKSKEAYVDTSAFIAFLDRSDTYHQLFRNLFASPSAIVSTPLVVAEVHPWCLRRYDRTKALQFLSMIEEMPLEIVQVGRKEQEHAIKSMQNFSDQNLTLGDSVGLHLMRSRKIQRYWSTDFHLGLTGVSLVINS